MRKTYREEREKKQRQREAKWTFFLTPSLKKTEVEKMRKMASTITQVSTMPQQSEGNKG